MGTTGRRGSQSQAAYAASGLDFGDLERRTLELRGRAEPLEVRVVNVATVPV